MSALLIEGGKRLHGAVKVHGAKNSVLPILAAAILGRGESVIHNCPALSDVTASVAILEHLGCRVRTEGDTLWVDASQLVRSDVPDALMREMRSSVIFLGAVLARTGEAEMSFPGGCELGPRPIDLHLAALRRLGAEVAERAGALCCTAVGLTGCDIVLSLPSVGATENAMLAATGAEGVTTITNAARDRIVAATYLSAAAAAGGEAELTGVDYRHLSTVIAVLSEAGCAIRSTPERICIRADRPLRGVRPVRTAPYPGFPTDAQAPVMAALCTAEGTSVFVENIFESRYRHVDELCRMGADIRVEGRVAVVCGGKKLHGAAVKAADLRGAAALVVAALGARGRSTVTGLAHADRGYQDLAGDLRALGAEITRTEERET